MSTMIRFWGPFTLELMFAATLLPVTAFLFNSVFFRATASMRHRVWSLCIAGLLVFPVCGLLFPEFGDGFLAVGNRKEKKENQEEPVAAVEKTGSSAAAEPLILPHESDFLREIRESFAEESAVPVVPVTEFSETLIPPDRKVPQPESSATEAVTTHVTAAATATSKHRRPSLPMILLPLWGVGIVAGLGVLLRSYGTVRWLIRNAEIPDDPSWQQLADEISRKAGLADEVLVVISRETKVPFVTGCLRPLICLPETGRTWPEPQRRAVLVHEILHVRRGDLFWQWAASLACVLYWCHPFVWAAAKRMRTERETACDDAVILFGEEPESYAQTLLGIAAMMTMGRPQRFGCAVAVTRRSKMEHRIRAILQTDRNRSPVGKRTAALLTAGTAALLFLTALLSPFHSPEILNAGTVAGETPQPQGTEPPPEAAEPIPAGPAEPSEMPSEMTGADSLDRELRKLYEEKITLAEEAEQAAKASMQAGSPKITSADYALIRRKTELARIELARFDREHAWDAASAAKAKENLVKAYDALIAATEDYVRSFTALYEAGRTGRAEVSEAGQLLNETKIQKILAVKQMKAVSPVPPRESVTSAVSPPVTNSIVITTPTADGASVMSFPVTNGMTASGMTASASPSADPFGTPIPFGTIPSASQSADPFGTPVPTGTATPVPRPVRPPAASAAARERTSVVDERGRRAHFQEEQVELARRLADIHVHFERFGGRYTPSSFHEREQKRKRIREEIAFLKQDSGDRGITKYEIEAYYRQLLELALSDYGDTVFLQQQTPAAPQEVVRQAKARVDEVRREMEEYLLPSGQGEPQEAEKIKKMSEDLLYRSLLLELQLLWKSPLFSQVLANVERDPERKIFEQEMARYDSLFEEYLSLLRSRIPLLIQQGEVPVPDANDIELENRHQAATEELEAVKLLWHRGQTDTTGQLLDAARRLIDTEIQIAAAARFKQSK
jgi:beta-lactamase regulating signal transducer with metallopeptidase domain